MRPGTLSQRVALRADLVRVARRQGQPEGHAPGPDYYDRHGQVGAAKLVRLVTGLPKGRGGTWRRAVQALGLRPASERRVSREEAISELQRVAIESGRPFELPRRDDYLRLGRIRYADLMGALLGDVPKRRRRWRMLAWHASLAYHAKPVGHTAEGVIEACHRVARVCGYAVGGIGPTRKQWKEHSGLPGNAPAYHFGSYSAMLLAAGYVVCGPFGRPAQDERRAA